MNTCGECKHFKDCWYHAKDTHPCVLFKIDSKTTNFAKIAKSPETLAEYIDEITQSNPYLEFCKLSWSSDPCPYPERGDKCKKCIVDWLNKEVEKEK